MKQLLWNSGTSPAPGQDSQLLMSSEVAKRCQSGLFSVCLCLCEPQGLDGLSCPGSPVHHTPAASSPSEPHPGRWQSRICRGMGLPNMLKQHKPCNPGHDAVNSQGLKIKTSMVLQFKGNTDQLPSPAAPSPFIFFLKKLKMNKYKMENQYFLSSLFTVNVLKCIHFETSLLIFF